MPFTPTSGVAVHVRCERTGAPSWRTGAQESRDVPTGYPRPGETKGSFRARMGHEAQVDVPDDWVWGYRPDGWRPNVDAGSEAAC